MTNDEAKTKSKFLGLERAEWRFVLKWVLASAVGAAVAERVGRVGMLVLILVVALVGRGVMLSIPGDTVGRTAQDIISWARAGASVGAGFGIAQWMLIRKRVHRAGWWVLASAVGWTVGAAVASATLLTVNNAVGTVAGLGSIKVAVGIAQWIFLRKRVHGSGRWVWVNAVAWVAALIVVVALSGEEGGIVGLGVGVGVDTVFTGVLMAKSLRRPIPEARTL
jgi:hypothetical protein